jgi:hypothetical protein
MRLLRNNKINNKLAVPITKPIIATINIDGSIIEAKPTSAIKYPITQKTINNTRQTLSEFNFFKIDCAMLS